MKERKRSNERNQEENHGEGDGPRRENIDGPRGGPEDDKEETTFQFPILNITRNIMMKIIPMTSLPLFYGKSSEDPDAFLFEFDILCRSYNYYDDAHKLKLFPATLKDIALRWFMSLGENTIYSWDDMKSTFLRKYRDYYKTRDLNDILRMQQLHDESLEEYLERFLYHFHKSQGAHLDEKTVKMVFSKRIKRRMH